ncbi:MAG TPA: prepilin-type N-terminal cleavage/methylation domain-containing protein [Candidatus Sulfotelmatobacter sp.]|nr:prepilin-type N-terminal cleavage/methylation domain-containing protein [Candidatus Sulfotelmatobacter sp.]
MARDAGWAGVGGAARLRSLRRAAGARPGFTLVELLVVVGVLAILSAFGLPALLGAVARSRVDSATGELVSALRQAQGQAPAQGGYFRVHLGTDPAVGQPNSFRIERDLGNGTTWPAPTDTIQANGGVVTNWVDLSQRYGPLTLSAPVDSAGRTLIAITYNNRGAFVDRTGPVNPPATITVSSSGGRTRTITAQFARAAWVQ